MYYIHQKPLQTAILKTHQLQYTDKNVDLWLRLQGIQRERILHQLECASLGNPSSHRVLERILD